MVPKDVKPSGSCLHYSTIARKKTKQKIAIKIKKEYIFIYPSYAYLYINNSYIWLQAGREFLPRLFKVLLFHHNKAVRVWKGWGSSFLFFSHQIPWDVEPRWICLNLSWTPSSTHLLSPPPSKREKKDHLCCTSSSSGADDGGEGGGGEAEGQRRCVGLPYFQ